MAYKLSIITINYNNKNGLLKTVESVVNQKNKDFEYLIIDGGSSDESISVIDAYKTEINYYISEKDSGVYNAMNKGIKAANGEFVLFLNSGDFLMNSEMTSFILPLLSNDTSIYYGNLIYSTSTVPSMLCKPPKELSFSFFFKLFVTSSI